MHSNRSWTTTTLSRDPWLKCNAERRLLFCTLEALFTPDHLIQRQSLCACLGRCSFQRRFYSRFWVYGNFTGRCTEVRRYLIPSTIALTDPRNLVKDWNAKYERLTNMVVPRTSTYIIFLLPNPVSQIWHTIQASGFRWRVLAFQCRCLPTCTRWLYSEMPRTEVSIQRLLFWFGISETSYAVIYFWQVHCTGFRLFRTRDRKAGERSSGDQRDGKGTMGICGDFLKHLRCSSDFRRSYWDWLALISQNHSRFWCISKLSDYSSKVFCDTDYQRNI